MKSYTTESLKEKTKMKTKTKIEWCLNGNTQRKENKDKNYIKNKHTKKKKKKNDKHWVRDVDDSYFLSYFILELYITSFSSSNWQFNV